ncbi:PIN domain-containing protein [Janibacter sp. DB-40]|uniref:PIN domain-containing protein n=1 Tax=Janibacter sp. DB-40 TaxID=3028808 RepID=UPI002406F662|nr:PIN domain-containing protein [Janibacter sp. DB-40]
MTFPVFLDTCVLYPPTLCDLLLRIAETGAFRPHWSHDVLTELERNLSKVATAGTDGAQRRVAAMSQAFPEASVTSYESLIDSMTCDPKDRHVLAAATHSGCQVIVTFNLKDFPADALAPHALEVVAPDDFLLDQLDLYPRHVTAALASQCEDSQRPPFTPFTLLESLARCGAPRFGVEVRRKLDIASWSR